MYALVEIAAQPTPTLPAGAVMEIWYAEERETNCLYRARSHFLADLASVSLTQGSFLLTSTTDEKDPVWAIVEWTIPGRPTRRFRIQKLPN